MELCAILSMTKVSSFFILIVFYLQVETVMIHVNVPSEKFEQF